MDKRTNEIRDIYSNKKKDDPQGIIPFAFGADRVGEIEFRAVQFDFTTLQAHHWVLSASTQLSIVSFAREASSLRVQLPSMTGAYPHLLEQKRTTKGTR